MFDRCVSSRCVGSSPRGRGKLGGVPCFPPRFRLIPAWAGKTCGGSGQHEGRWAHPRVGGENLVGEVAQNLFPGSSPRGRGKRSSFSVSCRPIRLIPAWAGKTGTGCGACSRGRAHPRVGGENRQALAQLDAAGGSSPRGRGKRQLPTKVVYARGLIPAWAGKTRQRVNCVTFGWAHPRVGGENPSGLSLGDDSSGSSPRGRGKLTLRHLPGPSGRLIPAWAGKTSRTMAASAASRAHPRVGGENGSGAVLLLDQSGSSPRGRGKP